MKNLRWILGYGSMGVLTAAAGACGSSTTVNRLEVTGGNTSAVGGNTSAVGGNAEGGAPGKGTGGLRTAGGNTAGTVGASGGPAEAIGGEPTSGGSTAGSAGVTGVPQATGGVSNAGGSPPGGSGASGAPAAGNAGEGPELPSICPVPFPGGTTLSPLIDDFDDDADSRIPTNGERAGFWYVWDDGTGVLESPNPDADNRVAAEPGVGSDGSYGLHASGLGFDDWGAAVEVVLNEWGGVLCPYDASAYDGIEFHIRGEPASLTVYVTMPDMIPVEYGGLCESGEESCDNHYYTGVDVPAPEEGSSIKVSWNELSQDSGFVEVPFDPGRIVSIQWEASPDAGSFDFTIDDVRFY